MKGALFKAPRVRLQLKPQRVRVAVKRTSDYYRLRYWWLHHLAQLRAKARINGINTKTEKRAAQRELVRLRKEH